VEQDGLHPVFVPERFVQTEDLLLERGVVRVAREPLLEQHDQLRVPTALAIDLLEALLVAPAGVVPAQQLEFVDDAVVVSVVPGVRDDLLAPVGGVVGRLGEVVEDPEPLVDVSAIQREQGGSLEERLVVAASASTRACGTASSGRPT
jgi:hypothetical protein